MAIFITHPEHGQHVVYTNDELKRHEAKGWKVREEPKPVPVAQAVIESTKRKPGRPRKER